MILLLLVAISAGILLDVIAFSANAGILWVVLGNKNLRKAPTSVFLLNLCVSDIFVSIFLIPIAITILLSASFEDNGVFVPTYLCGPVSFINSLLVYSGVWAAAAISVDRRFSIVAPMAHAAFMTTRRALMAIGMVWITAAIFALLPHIFPTESSQQLFNYTLSTSSVATAVIVSLVSSSSSTSVATSMLSNSSTLTNVSATINASSSASYYVMSINASSSTSVLTEDECRPWKTCALMFTLDWSNPSHTFAIVIGCYLIPALIMISMYLSIFKVARKAGLQVHQSSTMSIPTISGDVEAREELDRNLPEVAEEVDEEPHEDEEKKRERDNSVLTIAIESSQVEEEEEEGFETELPPRDTHLETNRNCIFRHLFWNDKKIDGIPPFHDSKEFGPPIICPECSSKSYVARWRTGVRRSLDGVLSDVSDSKRLSNSGAAGSKARRTLLLILGLSLASWTPYYLVHAYCACTNDCWMEVSVSKIHCDKDNPHTMDRPPTIGPISTSCNASCSSDMFPVSFFLYRRSDIVSIVVWLLFLSSAFNPILYGLLNRPVREQVILRASSAAAFCSQVFCQRVCQLCGRRGNPIGREEKQENEEGGVEDFLQFLERTSSLSDTPTTGSSILHSENT